METQAEIKGFGGLAHALDKGGWGSVEAGDPCPSSFGGEESCCPTQTSQSLSSSGHQQALGQVPVFTISCSLRTKAGPQSFGPSSGFCPAAQDGYYCDP